MECPYEKREDNGGKLIWKDKAKSLPNKNHFTKKAPPKVLVAQEEYNKEEEEDVDEDLEEVEAGEIQFDLILRFSSLIFAVCSANRRASCLFGQRFERNGLVAVSRRRGR